MHLKSILILSFILLLFHSSFAQDKRYTPTLAQLDSMLKTNCNLMKQINISDVDMLMVNDCKLNEVETVLEWLKFVNIASQIDFKKREEIAIYEYFTETTTQTAQLRVVINQYISNLDFWYYKKAMEYLAQNDTINANDKFEKSLLINPFYIPALYQKAMLYLGKSQTNQASSISAFAALNLYPAANDSMMIQAMNEQINKQYKTRGEKMLAAEYCNESLEIFMQADTFCKYFKSVDCEYFKNGIARSKYGLYRSYLRVADQAIRAHKYSIAETFVMKAKEYASANRSSVINDEAADKYLKNIANKYIDLGVYYKHNADDSHSAYYYEKATAICHILNDKECEALIVRKEQEVVAVEPTHDEDNTSIQPENKQKIAEIKHDPKNKRYRKHKRIKKHSKTKKTINKSDTPAFITKQKSRLKSRDYNLYASYIEMGDDFTGALKYEQALEKYMAAKAIEKTVMTKPNLILDSLINATAFNRIHVQLETAGFLIWANELAQADTVYQLSVSLQQKYHLENDTNTNASLNQFRQKIALKACQNVQDKIELLNEKATNYIAIKDFEKAQMTLNEIKSLVNKQSNCDWKLAKTNQLSQLLKPITDYYRLKEIAKAGFEKNDYKLFTENYYPADQLYIQAKLDSFGIPDNNIIAYLNYQSNEASIVYVANYFIKFYNFDNCLAALKLLKNKGFDANKVKEVQFKLAFDQSAIDKTQPLFDAGKNIMKYTGDDKWFRVFNAEYKKNK